MIAARQLAFIALSLYFLCGVSPSRPQWSSPSTHFLVPDTHGVNYNDTCPTPDYSVHCCRGKARSIGFQAEEHMHYTVDEQAEIRTEFYLRELLVGLMPLATPNLGCFLGFEGDSLMADTFMAMVCQLKMIGYSQQDCIPIVGGSYYKDGETNASLPCEEPQKRAVALMANSSTCPKITLAYFAQMANKPALPFLASLPPEDLQKNLTFIVNWGVHGNNQAALKTTLEQLAVVFSNYTDRFGVRLLWKETEAQHFGYSTTGLYDVNENRTLSFTKNTSICAPFTNYTAANWRNKLVLDMMGNGTFPRLPVISYFSESDRFFFLHAGNNDCTHYTYAPFKFEKLWHQVATFLALPM
jgi:hypothetical protein